jgi:proton-coupled amino acid transporter
VNVTTNSYFFPVAVAIAVPNLGPIISLVGAVCFSTLGLFCPAVIETVTYWQHGLGWRLWKNIFIILFAVLALLTGSYASVLEIISEYTQT